MKEFIWLLVQYSDDPIPNSLTANTSLPFGFYDPFFIYVQGLITTVCFLNSVFGIFLNNLAGNLGYFSRLGLLLFSLSVLLLQFRATYIKIYLNKLSLWASLWTWPMIKWVWDTLITIGSSWKFTIHICTLTNPKRPLSNLAIASIFLVTSVERMFHRTEFG